MRRENHTWRVSPTRAHRLSAGRFGGAAGKIRRGAAAFRHVPLHEFFAGGGVVVLHGGVVARVLPAGADSEPVRAGDIFACLTQCVTCTAPSA